jgi:hypothetical protein
VWSENRRVLDILHNIESCAIRLRERPHIPVSTELDGASPAIVLPMERPMYSPARKTPINSSVLPADDQADPAVLFDQVYVDPGPLRRAVLRSLRRVPQVGLTELVRDRPLRHGLAELIAYLSLNDDMFRLVFDDQHTEHLRWHDDEGRERVAALPRATFVRATSASNTSTMNGSDR